MSASGSVHDVDELSLGNSLVRRASNSKHFRVHHGFLNCANSVQENAEQTPELLFDEGEGQLDHEDQADEHGTLVSEPHEVVDRPESF
jgi:hypothetical protein